jgi:hypothetical protein
VPNSSLISPPLICSRGNRKYRFPQDTLFYAAKFTFWCALNIIGFVKPLLLEDVVHWKCHGAFSFCKEWLLVSRICLINQLECGHSDWYCSWTCNGHFHERVLGNGDHDWLEAPFEAVLKIIPIAVAFSNRRHWSKVRIFRGGQYTFPVRIRRVVQVHSAHTVPLF